MPVYTLLDVPAVYTVGNALVAMAMPRSVYDSETDGPAAGLQKHNTKLGAFVVQLTGPWSQAQVGCQ